MKDTVEEHGEVEIPEAMATDMDAMAADWFERLHERRFVTLTNHTVSRTKDGERHAVAARIDISFLDDQAIEDAPLWGFPVLTDEQMEARRARAVVGDDAPVVAFDLGGQAQDYTGAIVALRWHVTRLNRCASHDRPPRQRKGGPVIEFPTEPTQH